MSRSVFENLAARILYYDYDIITFPAPTTVYDLITQGGIKIEIKDARNGRPIEISPGLSDEDGVDLWMCLTDEYGWILIPHSAVFINITQTSRHYQTLPRAIMHQHGPEGSISNILVPLERRFNAQQGNALD